MRFPESNDIAIVNVLILPIWKYKKHCCSPTEHKHCFYLRKRVWTQFKDLLLVLPEKAVEGLLGKTTMQHIASQQSAGGLLVGGRGSYSLLVWELALCHQEGGLATVGKKYPKSLNTNSHSWVEAERQWLKSRFSEPTATPPITQPTSQGPFRAERERQTWRAQDNGSHKIIRFESNHTKHYQAEQRNTPLMLLLSLHLYLFVLQNIWWDVPFWTLLRVGQA